MRIPRLHLFEFEDFGWFPKTIRNLMTDFLRQSTIQMRLHLPIVGILEKATAAAGTDRIVDLCSGGGGLLVEIQKEMTKRLRRPVTVTFTDKFPNVEALGPICALDPEHLRFVAEPVDATAVPGELRGVRTMFSALHHFRPETATRILQDAVDNDCGIAVIEVSRRTLGGFVPMLLSPFATLAMTPWIRPFTFRRFALTYLVPLVPFFVMWDGIVSAFRTYTPEELRSMVGRLRAPGYSWDVGRVRGALGYKITYLVGAPT